MLLKNLSPTLFLSPFRDIFKLRLVREEHKLCSDLLERDNFQDLTFFHCFDLDLANWRRVGELGRKQELYNAKKFFWLWKFIFHIPIWQHKREAWSSLQKENR